MIRLKTLELKDRNPDGSINLLSNISNTQISSVIIDNFIEVDESVEMRPWAISYAAYGTIDYTDMLMKFNGIQNPYSIKRGDVIAIPNIDSYDAHTKTVSVKPVMSQRKKIVSNAELFTAVSANAASATSTTSIPSKKVHAETNFRKSSNGNIVY